MCKNRLDNQRVVLITGASRGIGREIAIGFAKSNSLVVINYVKEHEKANEVLREIQDFGGDGLLYQADISRYDSVKGLIDFIESKIKRLDVVINNAAICRDKPILSMPPQTWDSVIQTDLNGSFYIIKESAKLMIRNKSGSIINISSIVGIKGGFCSSNYSSAKAGLIALTKSAAMELGRFGITVNAILPGFHFTDMGMTASEEYIKKIKADSVLNTTTDIKELVEFIIFLSKIRTVSGQIFNWDSRII